MVEPVFETEQVEGPVIAAFHIRGREDYIVLQNNGQIMVDLSEYALSDEKNAWEKGRLPRVELAPGEIVDCKNKGLKPR